MTDIACLMEMPYLKSTKCTLKAKMVPFYWVITVYRCLYLQPEMDQMMDQMILLKESNYAPKMINS